ncbi:MAG: HEPN domain-containing protein [Magnetococcales bacterium]|nr:HEPN domain-containing protein [Magnetococcales bacterium]
MSKRNWEFCGEWIKKADHDLITARAVLSLPHGPTDTPCFHAQQAVEKALKGVLTFHGVPFGRTHDLLVLFDQVVEWIPEIIPFEAACGSMGDYAVEARYPGESVEPDRSDAMEALHVAEQVVAMVRVHCGLV